MVGIADGTWLPCEVVGFPLADFSGIVSTADQSKWPLDMPKIVLPAATVVLDEMTIRIDQRLSMYRARGSFQYILVAVALYFAKHIRTAIGESR